MSAPRTSPPLVLLGPQRIQPTLAAAFDRLRIEGTIAAVTAGWQEREAEVEEMREHVDRPVVNLLLHARAEQLFEEDPDLAQGYRRRQRTLIELQRLYRLRLNHTLAGAKEMFALRSDPSLLLPERKAAIAAVRRLDAHHLRGLRKVHQRFESEQRPFAHRALIAQRQELAEQLAGCSALAIAGGHVAALLNRLRLFGLLELAADLPIVAWSAGAMALAERVVLFHDHPPQGAGDAEILEAGLGLFNNLLPLPHARYRLRLDDPQRVAIFARRFAPAVSVTLDVGHRFERRDGLWQAHGDPRKLTVRGKVRKIKAGELNR